ncbi:MAG: 2,4-dichlorophenoxyacetate dioxygenase [Betaproteobacteria bacterium SG8_40]|jgi:alpha-ketoglutarate-dependent 2,4-dichlorophenoxyacetate dioxygenase|nr:MAG: 2,4-dichlorophenoxyacetate dioxygenase [Betaproteobacteria bacterium SG8_40]
MSIKIVRIHPHFVGEVSGVDLSTPISDDERTIIEDGINEHGVLVFRDQNITDEQQAGFSQLFGALEVPDLKTNITKDEDRRLGRFMADISNLDRGDHILDAGSRQRMFNLGNRFWHSDSSYRAVPAKLSLLSARVVPRIGGETQFADMCAAYDALDENTKKEIEGLICEHSLLYSRGRLGFGDFTDEEKANFKPVLQTLVRVHPGNGRRSLFLSAHAGKIEGWPTPVARVLLEELTEFATRTEFVYTHRWRPFDLVMWDNRRTMHRARRFDDTVEVRDMRRTTVAGEAPTVM